MTKDQYKELQYFKIWVKEPVLGVEALSPYLQDRTLLYGYTYAGDCFHVYLKDRKIHAVVYWTDCPDQKICPADMREIEITRNQEYIPNRCLYPEYCDYEFCKLLVARGIKLPFVRYGPKSAGSHFFTLEDALRPVPKVTWQQAMGSI